MRRAPGPARGFTLVETVVVLAVATVILSSLLGVQGLQARFVRERLREDAARRACAARLEGLAADRAALLPGTRTAAVAEEPDGLLGPAEVEETVAAAGPGLFSVEVRVLWSAAGGERRSVRLATLLAGKGDR